MTTFWIAEKGVVRSVDFSNPEQILETLLGPEDKLNLSKHFLEALRPTFETDQPNPPPAAMPPAAETAAVKPPADTSNVDLVIVAFRSQVVNPFD